jgi:hypothetical protein
MIEMPSRGPTFERIEQLLCMANVGISEYARAFDAVRSAFNPVFGRPDDVAARQGEAQRQWELAWEQMAEAERLIQAKGRDTSALLEVRAQVPPSQLSGYVAHDSSGGVAWSGLNPAVLTGALAALLIAVPEVSRSKVLAEAEAVPNLTGSRTGLVVFGILVLAILGVLVAWLST